MKCIICGAYNKSDYTKCYRCGADLTPNNEDVKKDKVILDHKSPLKNTPSFRQAIVVEERPEEDIPKKEAKKPNFDDRYEDNKSSKKDIKHKKNAIWTEKKKPSFFMRKSNKSAPVVAINLENSSLNKKNQKSRRRIKGTNQEKLSQFKEGTEIDVILPATPKEQKLKNTQKKKSGLKWGRLVFVSVVAASMIIGLIVGFFYLFKGLSSGVSSLFSGHSDIPNGGMPLVERLMINGQPWHRITFYGEDGERILVEDPIRSLSIQDGKAILLLDDISYIPTTSTQDQEESEFIKVALKASRFSKKGEETVLPVPSYNIDVPLSPLKVIYPIEESMEVKYSQVQVKLKVEPGSRVIVDNINLTDIVDSDGYVSKFVNLDPGDNDIDVEVRTNKHRQNTVQIKVHHPELAVPIVLTEPPANCKTEEVVINGEVIDVKANPNVDIYVDTSKLAAEVKMESDGKFKFTYVLNKFGWNEIEILANAPDGTQSKLIHRIERIPDHRQYTREAQKMDYNQLSTMANSIKGRIFKCTGEIVKRIETPTSRMYLFDVGIGDKLEFIIIEYSGNREFEMGKYYDVYADVLGTYDNYPRLAGRFIYDIDEADLPTPTPTPEPTPEPTEENNS